MTLCKKSIEKNIKWNIKSITHIWMAQESMTTVAAMLCYATVCSLVPTRWDGHSSWWWAIRVVVVVIGIHFLLFVERYGRIFMRLHQIVRSLPSWSTWWTIVRRLVGRLVLHARGWDVDIVRTWLLLLYRVHLLFRFRFEGVTAARAA
jgi:hypothetical protein